LRQVTETKFKKFINEFPNRNRSRSSLNKHKLLTKLHQTHTVDCKPGSGKSVKMWIAQNVDSVEELILGRENEPGTHKQFVRFKRQKFPNVSAWDRSCCVV